MAKTARIELRLTIDEKATLELEASQSKQTVSEYIRHLVTPEALLKRLDAIVTLQDRKVCRPCAHFTLAHIKSGVAKVLSDRLRG